MNTLKLLIRRLGVPHEMHGSRMMIPISALEVLHDDSVTRGIRASDRGHEATAVLDGSDDLSEDLLDALEQGRPGVLPWSAERPNVGQRE